ncbi:hypothetical protein BJ508DRAFT_367923 [Ascobolus immersus RN42]|uniref:Uncharacterized protein n=1 Tax=Ascobolus immersus RN42 TaxID=1160509 RepID=A0A3N4HCI9_ASCIM|nr:hypothetical protein BJ508DRAFT_367923 [Ascobolus immersus RN42]
MSSLQSTLRSTIGSASASSSRAALFSTSSTLARHPPRVNTSGISVEEMFANAQSGPSLGRIEKKLMTNLEPPVRITLKDTAPLSHHHHATHPTNQPQHFRKLEVASPSFDGLSKIEAHRKVADVLRGEVGVNLNVRSAGKRDRGLRIEAKGKGPMGGRERVR